MDDILTLLAVGDIVGRPGRQAAMHMIPELRQRHGVDLVIANGENASGGFGLSVSDARALFNCGVDIITSGNHIWDQKEIIPALDDMPILRPMNYPPGAPGRGWLVHDMGALGQVAVCNVQGLVFMPAIDSPFRAVDEFIRDTADVAMRVIDFHGEATSEKQAMGHFTDGRVSFLFGTHTHTATADQRVRPGGSAYVSDLGMVGPRDSVIGMDADGSLKRFLTGIPQRFKVAGGMVTFNSVVVRIRPLTGLAESIERIDHSVDVSSGD
ncbi:MAG: YmdB family metallophosphoesterase [Candidatus Dormibacteraeota bacterium]|nr:YmdB family metallophosphoesterase [Candidatus Dormibacteraeota bacterium]